MESSSNRAEWKANAAAVLIYLCAVASMTWMLFGKFFDLSSFPPGVFIASEVGLVAASVAVFLRPRVGYWVALASGILALLWFARNEFYYFPAGDHGSNSWVLFNLPDHPFNYTVFLIPRILVVATVVTSIACSSIRLLPSDWLNSKRPLRERTWPAFVFCFVAIAIWYGVSVSPYRTPPLGHHGVSSVELRVLHVQKRGVQFHETAFLINRDGRLFELQNDRMLFNYGIRERAKRGSLPETLLERSLTLAHSSQLNEMKTPPAQVLRSWNAEGWYIRTSQKVLAFSTENGTQPPGEIVALFHDLESVPVSEQQEWTSHDICMGFCYDPLAGLGLSDPRDRCELEHGTNCE